MQKEELQQKLQLFMRNWYLVGKRISTTMFRTLRKYTPHIGGVILAFFFGASTYAYYGVYVPPTLFPLKTVITVPEGASVSEIANLLYEEQVIRSPLAFRTIFTLDEQRAHIKAGDYYFEHPLTLTEVARHLADGIYGLEPLRITIPEGATTYQMAELFADKYEKFDPVTFLLLTKEKEGYLFPDTYQFLPNVTTAQIVEKLERTFYERIQTIEEDIASFGRPVHEIVTMASLLEKEAYDHDDRRKIAGVLWKRIAIGMPLQVDAVFGYIAGTETFNPTYNDLEVDSPYNTYKNTGLPPGPIGNPSLSSLEAAVKPVDTDALFYLHGKDGILRLANTYDEHLNNKYRFLD